MHSFRVQLAPTDQQPLTPTSNTPGGAVASPSQSSRRRRRQKSRVANQLDTLLTPMICAPAAAPDLVNNTTASPHMASQPPIMASVSAQGIPQIDSACAGTKSYQLIQNRAHYRLRSISPRRSLNEPPGVWLDVLDDDTHDASMDEEDEDEEDEGSYYDDFRVTDDEMMGMSADEYGLAMSGGHSWLDEEATFHSGSAASASAGSGRRAPGETLSWGDGTVTPPSLALTPFVNQVGGHTPFLKFSGSAICKPMNERERAFYEAVDYLHRDLYRFVPSCLGVVNVTYRKRPEGGDPVPEIVLEQNLHILPSCLARQLVPSPSSGTAAPGSFGARKMHLSGAWRAMQEQILKDALSPRALKARARQQAKIRAQGPVRRRHSSTDLQPAHFTPLATATERSSGADDAEAAHSLDMQKQMMLSDMEGLCMNNMYDARGHVSSTNTSSSSSPENRPSGAPGQADPTAAAAKPLQSVPRMAALTPIVHPLLGSSRMRGSSLLRDRAVAVTGAGAGAVPGVPGALLDSDGQPMRRESTGAMKVRPRLTACVSEPLDR
ncbi:inositol polyphosphate kinase kcs1, partial [Linderina macrospora]